jgi:hypothetical protein
VAADTVGEAGARNAAFDHAEGVGPAHGVVGVGHDLAGDQPVKDHSDRWLFAFGQQKEIMSPRNSHQLWADSDWPILQQAVGVFGAQQPMRDKRSAYTKRFAAKTPLCPGILLKIGREGKLFASDGREIYGTQSSGIP